MKAIGQNTLEVISPDRSSRMMPLAASPFLIGRGDESGNHLQLADPRISRRCATIISGSNGYLLEDNGHRAGVFVNGEKIERRFLEDGDAITFGIADSYEIIFHSTNVRASVENMLTRIGKISSLDASSAGLGKLNLLLEATSLLHSDLPLDSVLGTMLDHAVAITHAERGILLEADSSGELCIRLARGKGGVALPTEGLNPSQTALRQATAQQASVLTEDLNLGDINLKAAQSVVAQSLRAVVAIPLYAMSRTRSPDSAKPSGQGHYLGALYLDSRRATAFSKIDRQILDALAVEAASILDNARLVERERQRMRLEQELDIARHIQQALIPSGLRDFPYFAVSGIHTPCHAVGGDYFDVFPLSDERTAIIVADVSGKGLGAALLTTMLQGALTGLTIGADPVQVFDHLNRFLCGHEEVGRYATMFFGILDASGHLVFINAGHPSPLILRRGEVIDLLKEGSFPVGLVPQATFTSLTATLQPDDTLVMFSDGVTEASDAEDQMFGVPRLRQALSGQHDTPLERLQKSVLESIEKFTNGSDQNDDITLLLVRYRGAAKAAAP
ncbi:MAG TPA: SpoIIE family protein phosphatase [Candidatus Dormibacteraeota bacterium]|nr:SpoIIE family protein phosphatase [Candidatus Dormibacteraeota bacterium]